MTAEQMLKKAGFPNTEEGRKAFYKKYPTKESFMKKYAKGMKKYAEGGDTELAFPQQPDSDQFFNMGTPASFPGPFYAHGGMTMPLVHYRMAGQVDPQAAQAMMDNQGGNIPLATNLSGASMSQLPRFADGGMDPKSMAEHLLTLRSQYGNMTKRQLKKEKEDIQDSMSNSYQENDPSLGMRLAVITELLGEDMATMQTGGIAFPQQPAENQFFTGEHFNNQYRKGGAPCYKCGGMYDTGGNTPFNYGYFPVSMADGGYVGLDTADNTDYLTYAQGGEAAQGYTMDDIQNAQQNQFKKFLTNNTEAYNAGKVIQAGQLPQNNYGGYDAMQNYMPYKNSINTNNLANINARYDRANALEQENTGAGRDFFGHIYDAVINQRAAKAKYGYSLPKHETQGVTTGATNTGTPSSAGQLTKEQMDFLTQAMKESEERKKQANQYPEYINPITGQLRRYGYPSYNDYSYKMKIQSPQGKLKMKGRGSGYPGAFPYFGTTPGTQGQTGSGMSEANIKKLQGLNITQTYQPGNFWRRAKTTTNWNFGSPSQQSAGPMQGPMPNPNQSTTTPGTSSFTSGSQMPASQSYGSANPYDRLHSENAMRQMEGLDYSSDYLNSMGNQMVGQPSYPSTNDAERIQAGVEALRGYAMGGHNDVVWMDEDDIRKFEAGGGVLEYLDGGQFKQYY